MIAALARPPIARIVRTTRVWLVLGAWCALAIAVAIAARHGSSARGAFHVLTGVYGGVAVPLMTYAIVGTVVGPRSIAASVGQLAAFGAPPARAAAVAIAVAMTACALACALLAAAIAMIAHGLSDPPPLPDAILSAYAGFLGGAAYAAWFAFGATFGRRGMGRAVLLVVDWTLGATDGAGALFTPRGHLRNLLGGAPPMELPESASVVGLVLLALVCATLASRRALR